METNRPENHDYDMTRVVTACELYAGGAAFEYTDDNSPRLHITPSQLEAALVEMQEVLSEKGDATSVLDMPSNEVLQSAKIALSGLDVTSLDTTDSLIEIIKGNINYTGEIFVGFDPTTMYIDFHITGEFQSEDGIETENWVYVRDIISKRILKRQYLSSNYYES